MNSNKKIRKMIHDIWEPMIGYGTGLVLALALLSYKLINLVPGFSAVEKASIAASRSVSVIVDNPLYAPHKVLQYIMAKLAHTGFVAMRGVSVIIALGLVALFFYTLRRWFSFRVALITTLLLTTSSWFLHTARLATPDVLLLSLIGVAAYGTWLPKSRRPRWALALGLALLVWLLYIPSMIWFVIIGIIWQRRRLTKLITHEKSIVLACGAFLLIVLLPLIYALSQDTELLKTYLGLPPDLMKGLVELPKNLLLVPLRLVLLGSNDPVHALGRMPLLDFFASGMVVLGAYNFFVSDRALDRTKFLVGGLTIAVVLVALSGGTHNQLLLPFMYLLVASGVAYTLSQWFKVFPTNPFAKIIIGFLLLAGMATVGFYHVSHYFIAWPQAPITKQTFNQRP